MMDAFACGIDVEDYARVMYEAARLLENAEGEQQHADTSRIEEEEQQPEEQERQQHQRDGRSRRGSRSRSRQPRHDRRANATTAEDVAEEGEGKKPAVSRIT
jgi:hypothetical protein